MTWLDKAKALPVGRTIKIKHDCAPTHDPSLIVSHSPDAYRAFCFRCKDSMWEPIQLSLAERVALSKAQREADASVDRQEMPAPLLRWQDWPPEAMLWFLKAGLGEADAVRMQAGYHERTRRVVLPLLDTWQQTGVWQARAVYPGQKPKYLTSKGPRGVGFYHLPKGRFTIWPSKLVLTEDMLSAYKVAVSNPNVAAMPLTGTTLHDEHLARILHTDMPVLIWLDPDGPGQKAAAEVAARLRTFDVAHENICLESDPKLMPYDRIRFVVY